MQAMQRAMQAQSALLKAERCSEADAPYKTRFASLNCIGRFCTSAASDAGTHSPAPAALRGAAIGAGRACGRARLHRCRTKADTQRPTQTSVRAGIPVTHALRKRMLAFASPRPGNEIALAPGPWCPRGCLL